MEDKDAKERKGGGSGRDTNKLSSPSAKNGDGEESKRQEDTSEKEESSNHTTTTEPPKTTTTSAAAQHYENTYGEEESLLVEIPAPGLRLRMGATKTEKPPTRCVSGMCTICLCPFEVGNSIVWSSNELCDHVYHEACIEKWLMKQREGPLCPCCRRDFIVDPYDLESQHHEEEEVIDDGARNNESVVEASITATAAAAVTAPTTAVDTTSTPSA